MNVTERCLPWYYPQVDPEAKVCSPLDALTMRERIDTMPNDKCQVSE